MFDFGFTRDDLKRVLWTVLQAGVAAALLVATSQSEFPTTWDGTKKVGLAVAVAFVAGCLSALKNLFLADGSSLK